MILAWALAATYLLTVLSRQKPTCGLLLLPTSLALIAAANLFPQATESVRFWALVHGLSLALGTGLVVVGFLAGVMYLVQSYRLKRKLPPRSSFWLPSLEWLQWLNERSLYWSMALVGLGLITGILLNLIRGGGEAPIPWSDPVVITSFAWLAWLVSIAVFNTVYRPARHGRKVAYETVASFLFLSVVLGIIRLQQVGHGTERNGPNAASVLSSSATNPVPSPRGDRPAMKLQLVGCSHHTAPIEVRERLAFSREQIPVALGRLRDCFPQLEAVLLSTCNRVELYTAAAEAADAPSDRQIIEFLADFHGLRSGDIAGELYQRLDADAVRHLFCVAASLDSMVMGEPQILSQVKEAYQLATAGTHAGPLLHAVFQAAIHVRRRVAHETAIHQKRVSVPSVAVADFASQIFERFDDKRVLVIGAGEMARETLSYLVDFGARQLTLVNRDPARAAQLAAEFRGRAEPWESLGSTPDRRGSDHQHDREPASRSSPSTAIGPSKLRATSAPCSCSTWPSHAISTRHRRLPGSLSLFGRRSATNVRAESHAAGQGMA